MSQLHEALTGLIHGDPRHRDMAVEYVGDLLRARTALTDTDAELAVTWLVALLAEEADAVVQESALNAIGDAFNHHRLGLQLFEPLRPLLAGMSAVLLDHALYIFAATHDQQARPVIEAFLRHPDPEVRGYAREALAELPGRSHW